MTDFQLAERLVALEQQVNVLRAMMAAAIFVLIVKGIAGLARAVIAMYTKRE